MFDPTCPVCDNTMSRQAIGWRYVCPGCRFERSDFAVTAGGETGEEAPFDAERHKSAHETMRRRIYERVLDITANVRPLENTSVLDVGCSYGWFLDAARARGMQVQGLEPDPRSAAIAKGKGNTVVEGSFPESLADGTTFDVIVFNDVFEHLPDVQAAIDHCRRHLNEGGLLVLNLPSSKGLLYRIALWLDRFGFHGPLERLWLRPFPWPHLSYFSPDTLECLAARFSFIEVARDRLPSIEGRDLWNKLHIDTSASLIFRGAVWVGLLSLLPFMRLAPADIMVLIFRKTG